jgi:hypothetical protein
MITNTTQLVMDGTSYPEAYGGEGSYSCTEEELNETVEMISGRMVKEQRGLVYHIEYEYPYIDNEMLKSFLASARKGSSIQVQFLVPGEDDKQVSQFICTDFSIPQYAFTDRDGAIYWKNISISLREVKPHA